MRDKVGEQAGTQGWCVRAAMANSTNPGQFRVVAKKGMRWESKGIKQSMDRGRTPSKAVTPSNESIFVWQTASCSLADPGWEGQQVKFIEEDMEADHARLDEKS